MKKLFGSVVFIALSMSRLYAQTAATGALVVTVRDASGGVIPNASVTVSNTAGLTRTQNTNAEGSRTFPLLPPGDDYKVAISAPGFRTAEVPSISVHVTETAAVNQSLEVGSQSQAVEVTGEIQAIQTESAALGAVVNARSISALPLTTRNYTQILNLSAGVVTGVNNAAAVGIGLQGIFVNGGDDTSNTYQMDGVGISNYAGGAVGSAFYGTVAIPSPDALQEFKVQTSNYDASYGRTSGSTVNVVTKTGTNDYHGGVFEFLRNDDLNANTFFRNSTGQPRGVLKQNQFGGTFGGPIRKDKLFFFVSYQGTRQLNGIAAGSGSSTITLPATLTDNRSAAALGAAFCPDNNPAGSPGYNYARAFLGGGPAFPLNQVNCNGSNINPVAVALLNAKLPDGTFIIPSPQTILNPGTQAAAGFSSFSIPASFRENQALGNFDYMLSAKHTVALKYYYSYGTTINSFQGSQPPGAGLKAPNGNNTFSGKLTSIVSSSVVNEARFSSYYIRAYEETLFPVTGPSVGVTPSTSANIILPVINITGLLSFGGSTVDANRSPQQVYEWSDQISWVHGKHSLRMGYDQTRIAWDICSCGKTRGSLTFQTWADFLLGKSAAQNGTSQSNIFTTSASGQPFTEPNFVRDNQLSAFIQDDFKLSRRLTINAGLRWEYDGTDYDLRPNGGTNAIWSLLTSAAIPPVTGTYIGYSVPKDYKGPFPDGIVRRTNNLLTYGHAPFYNFAPRIGFAWQPNATGDRFVVRGGYGWFWQVLPGQHYLDTLDGNPPLAAPVSRTGASNSLATFAVPFNPAVAFDSFDTFLRTPTSSLSYTAVDPNLITPLTMTWNMNVQYAIKPRWVLEVGYVGTRALHIETSEAKNIPILASAANPVNCAAPFGCITTNTSANAAQRVPVLGVTPGGFRLASNVGDSHYHGLQTTIRKQFSHGLQLQASYTFGKCLGDVDGTTTQTGQGGSVNSNAGLQDRRQARGECDYDRPQRLVVNYVYQFPAFHNAHGFAGIALSGWGLSGVTTKQTGQPLTFTDTRGGTVYGNVGTARAQMCPGMTYDDITTSGSTQSRLNSYFNPAAFCAPPLVGGGTATGYGNTGRSIVLGPGQYNWDFAITKKTVVGGIRENAYLEFRSEYFNAMNHPQFSNPGTQVNSAASLGIITSTSVGPRIIQFALRYAF